MKTILAAALVLVLCVALWWAVMPARPRPDVATPAHASAPTVAPAPPPEPIESQEDTRHVTTVDLRRR